jgi:hypothetical protein
MIQYDRGLIKIENYLQQEENHTRTYLTSTFTMLPSDITFSGLMCYKNNVKQIQGFSKLTHSASHYWY